MNSLNHKKSRIPVWVIDSTLRDGEQAPGVVFKTEEKIKMAAMLSEAGVDELEIGVPAMGDHAVKEMQKIADMGLNCKTTAWCRAKVRDIELAKECRTSGVHISFPTSEILLGAMGKDEQWVIGSMQELICLAKGHFPMVSVGAQDATRTDPVFLKFFTEETAAAGAHRIRIADTVGISRPSSVHRMIRDLKEAVPGLAMEFHGHNDLGMATANSITAVEAGADALSVTVNGLGERAGNAPLEEIAVALSRTDECRITLSSLMKLCDYVSGVSRRPIHNNKPISGKDVFSHESGIHCSAMLRDNETYQPYDPKMVGRDPHDFVIGSHSGSAVIKHILNQSGISINGAEARELLHMVRNAVGNRGEALSRDELIELYALAG